MFYIILCHFNQNFTIVSNVYTVILQTDLSQRKGGMIRLVWLYYAMPLLNPCSLARAIVYMYVTTCSQTFS